jgi:LysR family hydrogen peroxide-inducible transcriptional activator
MHETHCSQGMELEQLRHFLRVAEFGNFTRAAGVIGLSQPALSRSIARLEEELGQPVFERQLRQVTLTDAGRLLHERAQQIVALVEDAKAQISDDGQTGIVRIGAIPTIAPFFLPQILRDFRADFSGATVIVEEETTGNLVHKLADGIIDLALLVRPVEAKYLHIEHLFEEELLLALSPEHPLCAKRRIRLPDIESLPFILLNEAHCLTDNVLSFCRHHAVQPVSIEHTSQLATVQELVSLNHGISLIPAMACGLDTRRSISSWPISSHRNCTPLPPSIVRRGDESRPNRTLRKGGMCLPCAVVRPGGPAARLANGARRRIGVSHRGCWDTGLLQFKKHGQAGIEVSELFPQVASCVDDLCIVRSMVGDNINHNGACLQMNTGEQAFSRPSMGSWLLYGLNQNLPGFVVISPSQPA